MRSAFWIGVALSALCLILAIMSLWSFIWLSPSKATRLALSQGRLWVWAGQPDDFAVARAGFDTGGWSGDAIIWGPEWEAGQTMWIQSSPLPAGAPPGTSVMAKQIVGLSIGIPMWMPLLASVLPTATLPVLMLARGRRRVARGQCRRCGYHRGPSGPCPECGTPLRRLLARARALLRGQRPAIPA